MGLDALIVLPSFGSGGAERVVSLLASDWSRRGYKVAIYVIDGSDSNQWFYRVSDLVLTETKALREGTGCSRETGCTWLCRLLGLRRVLQRSRPSTVVGFLPAGNVYSILASIGLSHRVIISERNCIKKRKLPFKWRLLRRLCYRLADCLVVNLATNVREARPFVSEKRVRHLKNPFSPPKVSCPAERAPTVLAIGRYTEQKRLDLVIQAFEESGLADSGWRLDIVGEGEMGEELEHLAASQRSSCDIHFIRPYPELWNDYSSASIFVLMSAYEGMPNALLEAMYCGLIPLVSPGVGDLVNPIREADPRLIIDSWSANTLSVRMNQIASDFGAWTEIRDALAKVIEPYFSPEVEEEWARLVFHVNDRENQ